jgi:hypothetical protein
MVAKYVGTVWTVDFETPVRKLYLLFFLSVLPKKKKKSTAAYWCFKVCSPYSNMVGAGFDSVQVTATI